MPGPVTVTEEGPVFSVACSLCPFTAPGTSSEEADELAADHLSKVHPEVD